MQDNLFDRKTYNQIKTDLIHIQNDLMTTHEQHAKVAHVVNFVQKSLPDVLKVSSSEEQLDFLNDYFKIKAKPVFVPTLEPSENRKTRATNFMQALRAGRIPDDEILDNAAAKGGKVYIIEEDGDPYPLDRASVADYLGNMLSKNKDNSLWVKKFLTDDRLVDLMHQKGLIEQINHAFKKDKMAFLDVFEEIAARHPFDNSDLSQEILKFLFRAEMASESPYLYSFLDKLKKNNHNVALSLLIPLARKKYPRDKVKYWDKIKPETELKFSDEPLKDDVKAKSDGTTDNKTRKYLIERREDEPKLSNAKNIALRMHSLGKRNEVEKAKQLYFKALAAGFKKDILLSELKKLQGK